MTVFVLVQRTLSLFAQSESRPTVRDRYLGAASNEKKTADMAPVSAPVQPHDAVAMHKRMPANESRRFVEALARDGLTLSELSKPMPT